MRSSALTLNKPVKELFFLLAPPPHIVSDVSVLKDDVQFLIGHELEDRYSKGHISLFKYSDQHIDDIIRFVATRATHFKPFNVFLKNLNVFHHGSNRTIYMDVVNKYPIRDIFEKVVKEDINFTPHISIAKNMSIEDFLKCWAWVHYRDIMFGG